MKRCLKKTVAFSLMLVVLITYVFPWSSVSAAIMKEYSLRFLANLEYTDATGFGEGYLMLKDGTFNDFNKNTTLTYVDSKGNKREIKNNVGFTDIYLATSRGIYCTEQGVIFSERYQIDDGVLTVGKDNKVALMDSEGNLYGGEKNFYACVLYAGSELFYTTDVTENIMDKANTTRWTLRKKDGSVIKELYFMDMYNNRVHCGDYEYVNTYDNGVKKLYCISKDGNIITMGEDYTSVVPSLDNNYVIARKGSDLTVFNNSGSKLFDLSDCTQIDVDLLEEKGFAIASMVDIEEEFIYSKNVIDLNGNKMFNHNRYDRVTSNDGERFLTIDKEERVKLVDILDKTVFDATDFAKIFGETYFTITNSAYYVDSKFVFSINDGVSERNNQTFVFDKNGQNLISNIEGLVYDFNGEFMVLGNEINKSRVVDLTGKTIGNNYEHIILNRKYNKNVDNPIIAMGYDINKINLILKNGEVVDKYRRIVVDYSNDYYMNYFLESKYFIVEDDSCSKAVINQSGEEIVPLGAYEDLVTFRYSDCIVGYKDGFAYLLDKNGVQLTEEEQFTEVGMYKTYFKNFGPGARGILQNYIKKDNSAIVKDINNKFGVIIVENISNEGDINGDGIVDVKDLSSVAIKYNTKESDEEWNINYDLNSDGIIDIFDLVLLAKKI